MKHTDWLNYYLIFGLGQLNGAFYEFTSIITGKVYNFIKPVSLHLVG